METRTRLTLLLVDDDDALREATHRLAERANYNVRAVHSGEEALALLAEGLPVDIILSDVDMPGISGTELLAAVHHRYPVVLMSGGFSASGPGRLAKPFTGDLLAQVLQEALLRHAA